MNDSELRRSDRYRLAADRDRFTLATVVLRVAAGRALGVPASSVLIDRTCTCGAQHGRPRLPGTLLQVSISHSGDVVAVAMTSAGPVGVDIEQHDIEQHGDGRYGVRPGGGVPYGFGHPELATTVCTGSELPQLGSPADFHTYWTRKEAVLKATGDGLRRPMTSIEVTPPNVHPALVSMDGSPLACRLIDLRLAGYAGAVAVLTRSEVWFDVIDAARLLLPPPAEWSPRCA